MTSDTRTGLTRCTIAAITDTRGIDEPPTTGIVTHAAAEQLVEQLETLEDEHTEGGPGVTVYVIYREGDGSAAHTAHFVAPSALDAITQQLLAVACC